MPFEVKDKLDFNLLSDFGKIFPQAFAVWYFDGDRVFISSKLKSIIKIGEDFLSVYDFITCSKKYFGNFLYTASEILSKSFPKTEYSSIVSHNMEEQFLVKLIFNREKNFYMFLAEKFKDNENSAELNNILNSLPIYVWKKDLDQKIKYCNKAYSDAVESSQESVVLNNLHLVNVSKSRCFESSLQYNKTKSFIEKVVIKGTRKYLEITDTPCIGNMPSLSFAIDVTEKEELKNEYKNYKKQTEETLDHISVPIAIFDENMDLVFTNSAIEKLFGLDVWTLGGKSFSEIISAILDRGIILTGKDYTEFKETAIALCKEIMEPYHVSICMQNGKIIDVLISPNQNGGIIFMFEDISDTVELKREMSSISVMQQETLNHLKEGIIVFGTDNRVKIVNSAVFELCSCQMSESYKELHIKEFFKKISDSFSADFDMENFGSNIINLAAQKLPVSDFISLASGKVLEYSYIPISDGINLIRLVDNTDKTNFERTLKEKEEVVSNIDKIKGNLISNISYELRAPLNTIMGFTDILLNKYFGDLNEKQLKYCNGILGSVSRVIDVVNAIINLTSIEIGQIKLQYVEVGLFNFLEENLELFKNTAISKNVIMVNKFSNKNLKVYLDEKSMKQVMFQILSKALKTTPAKGEISVDVVVPSKKKEMIQIIISDTGSGIPYDDMEGIQKMIESDFGSFVVKEPVDFSFVIASNILKLHGGNLFVESEFGKGTTVKCCFPLKN